MPGWLQKLTQFLLGALHAVFDALKDFIGDQLILFIHFVLQAAIWLANNIPVPDFINSYSLSTVFGSAGPVVGWLFSAMQIGRCFTVLGLGWAFRLVRKALTLGQW